MRSYLYRIFDLFGIQFNQLNAIGFYDIDFSPSFWIDLIKVIECSLGKVRSYDQNEKIHIFHVIKIIFHDLS